MRFVNVLALAATAAALTVPSTHRMHEKRDTLSEDWIRGNEVPHHAVLPVRIGMQQQNLDRGYDLLMEVSDPASPKYGKHYSAEKVAEIFQPAKHTVENIKTWLHESGIDKERVSQSWNKQWIEFDASHAELSDLLKTKFHEYWHAPTEKTHVACDEYHVPHHLEEHIDYITPGIKLLAPARQRRSVEVVSSKGLGKKQFKLPPLLGMLPAPIETLLALPLTELCGEAITPDCIFAMYNITRPTTKVAGNQLGIFEDLGDHYSPTDLQEFFLTLAPQIPSDTVPQNRLIDGATGPSTTPATAGLESDLDFQISYPIIYPQQSVLFQTDDDPTENSYTYSGFLNNFLDAIDGSYCTYKAFGISGNSPRLDPPYPDPKAGGYKKVLQCGKYKPTNVITISYGGQEPGLPMNYQRRQCNEFMKLGMQGVSVFVASGDSGVAGAAAGNGNGCIKQKIFNPDFPASCPYITAVGATVLPPGGDPHKDEETAVTRFPSGGGFSNIYPQPAYQKSAVNTYLTKHTPPYKAYATEYNKNIGGNGGLYNAAGRGYPDISAIGDNIIIFGMGAPTLIGGTSASSPLFAAVLTRINEARLLAGKSTVGFINPTLYAHPDALHDITVGSNPGCGTNGFKCAKGWDPVTGLGTPSYHKLLKVFMALPSGSGASNSTVRAKTMAKLKL